MNVGEIPKILHPHGRSTAEVLAESMESKQTWASGAQRDTQKGKVRFSLIPLKILERLARRYTEGGEHYGDYNWQKGIPVSRHYDSMMRHVVALMQNKDDEDHGAAIIWNAIAMVWTATEFSGKPEDDRAKIL